MLIRSFLIWLTCQNYFELIKSAKKHGFIISPINCMALINRNTHACLLGFKIPVMHSNLSCKPQLVRMIFKARDCMCFYVV